MSAKTVNDIVQKWENGIKQKDIAKELGVSEAYISQVLAPFKNPTNINDLIFSNIPEEVQIAWDQIAHSIESAWGKLKKDGKRKWPSKYGHFLIVKHWIEKQN